MNSREEQHQDPVSVPPLPCALNLPPSSVSLSSPPPPHVVSPRCLPTPIVSLIASYCLLIYSFSLQHPHLLLPGLAPFLPIVGVFWRTSWEEESFCEPLSPPPPTTTTTAGSQTGRQTLIPSTLATVCTTSPFFRVSHTHRQADTQTRNRRRGLCVCPPSGTVAPRIS